MQVTCAVGEFVCPGQIFDAVLSDFICPVTCRTCSMPFIPYPSNFDGRIAWSFSPSTNIVEFYISSSESISSVTADVICVDNGFSLGAVSSSSLVLLVDGFLHVSGLSAANVANIQFVAATSKMGNRADL